MAATTAVTISEIDPWPVFQKIARHLFSHDRSCAWLGHRLVSEQHQIITTKTAAKLPIFSCLEKPLQRN